MPILIDGATEPTESVVQTATGPVQIQVSGAMANAHVIIHVQLVSGAGWSPIYSTGVPDAVSLLVPQGAQYKASMGGTSKTGVTVASYVPPAP